MAILYYMTKQIFLSNKLLHFFTCDIECRLKRILFRICGRVLNHKAIKKNWREFFEEALETDISHLRRFGMRLENHFLQPRSLFSETTAGQLASPFNLQAFSSLVCLLCGNEQLIAIYPNLLANPNQTNDNFIISDDLDEHFVAF